MGQRWEGSARDSEYAQQLERGGDAVIKSLRHDQIKLHDPGIKHLLRLAELERLITDLLQFLNDCRAGDSNHGQITVPLDLKCTITVGGPPYIAALHTNRKLESSCSVFTRTRGLRSRMLKPFLVMSVSPLIITASGSLEKSSVELNMAQLYFQSSSSVVARHSSQIARVTRSPESRCHSTSPLPRLASALTTSRRPEPMRVSAVPVVEALSTSSTLMVPMRRPIQLARPEVSARVTGPLQYTGVRGGVESDRDGPASGERQTLGNTVERDPRPKAGVSKDNIVPEFAYQGDYKPL
ncbi:hypothetical protein FB451DRAFT_1170460 [Mycena latifolia]|nr:hypothetical protein FB451DRAFT_1170460 [Mycena latifolia]